MAAEVDIATGLATYVVFVASTTLHEAAHATVALLGGDRTAYRGGQVSLNPLPHMQREPFGMVVLPLLGVLMTGFPIGFASAPYDPQWALQYPRRAALMSLAGPAANFALVVLAMVGLRLGLELGAFEPPASVSFYRTVEAEPGFWHAAGVFLGLCFSLNLLLAVLNLLPIPPLDGSGAIGLLLSHESANRWQHWMWTNRHLAMLGIVLAMFAAGRVFRPIHLLLVNVCYFGTGTAYE